VVTTGEIDFILLAYGKNLFFLRQKQVFASPVFTVEKTVFFRQLANLPTLVTSPTTTNS